MLPYQRASMLAQDTRQKAAHGVVHRGQESAVLG